MANLTTSGAYDALGRLTKVWLPNESKSAGAPANMTYSYSLSQTGPSVVASNTLLDNGSYKTSETLYDAMLRTLQVQATAENSSTTVTDTQYDSHGWTVVTNNAYNVAGNPGSGLISVSQVSIPETTVTDHDGLGRPDLVTEEHDGTKSWTTTTAYMGDRTTVLPPKGGVATTTVINARGQTTELDQYTAAPTLSGTPASGFIATSGTTSPTTYAYTPAGQQTQITGPDQTVWKSDYDLLGRKTSQTDPDAGKSQYGYDDAGNLISTTDARNVELDYTYDLLGRKLTGTDKSKSDFEFASWAYDTLRIGLPTSSTRYVQGTTGGYTIATTGYTSLGKPTGATITLPTTESPLPSTWTTTFGFSINDQLLDTQTEPRTQGLIGETLNYAHDALGNPTTTSSSANIYVASTVYTNYGEPSLITMGASTNPAWATYTYDDQTRRLKDRLITRTQAPGPNVDDTTYTYDAAGNPTSTTDRQTETGNTLTDQQCYSYDTLDRLTSAWTATDNCAANPPTTSTLATTAGAYWQTFSYDAIGDRHQSIDHAIGSTGTTVTTGYTNGCTGTCPNGTQPHTLTATTGGTKPTAFVYDADGNLITRTPTTGAGQKLTWDDEGHLAQVDTTGTSPTTTKYLYDADGNQLIRRDPGQTTLFAGDTEIVVNTSVTPNVLLGAVRTYTHGGTGAPVAVRSSLSGGGLKYLFNDPHGTATLAMDAATQVVARQQYTPYGQPRTSANTTPWADPTHSYLGKPQDTTTGYTDVGARKYAPTLGRFISPDPLLEAASPQQLGGYTYAADNPVTGSDPTGLMGCLSPDECGGGPQVGVNHPQPKTPTSGGNGGGECLSASGYSVSCTGSVGGSSQGSLSMIRTPASGVVPMGFAAGAYQALMEVISQDREKVKAATPNGVGLGDFTLVVAQVDVEEPQFEDPITPRFIVFSTSEIRPDLEKSLEDLGVAVVKAQGKNVHAEIMAEQYGKDVEWQKEDLGGKIIKVRNVWVTSRVCSTRCAQALGNFMGLGEEEAEALEGSNGMIYGKIVNASYLRAARKALGLGPRQGAAMRVVTDAMRKWVLPGQVPVEGAVEDGEEWGEK